MEPGSEDESQALTAQEGMVPESQSPVVPSQVMVGLLGVSWYPVLHVRLTVALPSGRPRALFPLPPLTAPLGRLEIALHVAGTIFTGYGKSKRMSGLNTEASKILGWHCESGVPGTVPAAKRCVCASVR